MCDCVENLARSIAKEHDLDGILSLCRENGFAMLILPQKNEDWKVVVGDVKQIERGRHREGCHDWAESRIQPELNIAAAEAYMRYVSKMC